MQKIDSACNRNATEPTKKGLLINVNHHPVHQKSDDELGKNLV